MKIRKALENMETKNLESMKQNIQETITQKAVEKLEEMKYQISQKFFGNK